MIRSISGLFARRGAVGVSVESTVQHAAPAQEAARIGCLPGFLRLRRTRAPAAPFVPSATLAENALLAEVVQASQWSVWAYAERDSGANCTEAIRRMKAFLSDATSGANELDLSGLRLKNLPPNMPAEVRHLDVSNNALAELPPDLPHLLQRLSLDHNKLKKLCGPLPRFLRQISATHNQIRQVASDLPASITKLRLNYNEIETLPESLPVNLDLLNVHHNLLLRLPNTLPPWLIELNAAHNQLERIPETLPESLLILQVSHNAIYTMPRRWPIALRRLDARDNSIEALPENIWRRLSQHCIADFRVNRISVGEEARIHAQMAQLMVLGRSMPSIILSEPVSLGHFHVRPLILAVAAWHMPDDPEVAPAWGRFQMESGAQAFAGFLDGLLQTRNVSHSGFREKMVAWLARLAVEPNLRAASFDEAIGATETCVDRVGLTLNAMKKLEIKHDVEQGQYDADLPQLVELSRATFRLKTLETIAATLANDNPAADEISIFLGLQVELRVALKLPTDAAAMTFLRLGQLQPKHFAEAKREVRKMENEAFPAFLAAWAPWQSVIERLDPASHAAAADALVETLGTPFDTALSKALAPDNLQHDEDAKRIAGPAVMTRLAQEIYLAQTVAFLADRKQSTLLDPPWSGAVDAVGAIQPDSPVNPPAP